MKKILCALVSAAIVLSGCAALWLNHAHIKPSREISAQLQKIPIVRVDCYLPGTGISFHGSGVIIDESGIILTASHCLKKNARFEVDLGPLGGVVSASPLPDKNFPDYDVAFIKIGTVKKSKISPLCERKYNAAELAGKNVYLKGHVMGAGADNKIIPGRIKNMWLMKFLIFCSSISWSKINNRIFVRIDKQDIDGISGGAVIMNGQVIAMIIEQWTLWWGTTYAAGVPIYRCLELYHRP